MNYNIIIVVLGAGVTQFVLYSNADDIIVVIVVYLPTTTTGVL